MANAALFIGYGPVVPGRAQQALQVFNEAAQYYSRLQQQGQIESFEPELALRLLNAPLRRTKLVCVQRRQ